MSYVVLARKYRPRNFREMVGQGHVVQALSNALQSQRLHHAYLFTGTRGVGKTTVSRILAKSLNCVGADGQGGITAEPCGVCQACTDIDAGRFVDYTELDAASNRGVDEVQSLLEQAVYKPVQGRFKVFMIDEVHMLTNTAFNAMLKTLEEPPEYLKFVLATTDPQKVPVTVLSRCLQFNLRPMAPETVAEHLQQVLQSEQVNAEPAALRLLARAARGSMRDALSLTDQAIAFGNGQLLEAPVRQMLGAVDRGHAFRLIDALAQGDGASVVQTVEALRLNGLNAASTLEEMTGVLQRMAVHQSAPEALGASSDPDEAQIAQLAHALPADETQLLYSLCLHGRTELGLAPDEYAGLTMVLLRLLAFKPAGTAEKKTPLKPAEARPSVATAPAAAAPIPEAIPAPGPAPGPAPTPVAVPVAAPQAVVAPTPAPTPAPTSTPAPAAPVPRPVLADEPPADDAPWPEPEEDAPPWDASPPPAAAVVSTHRPAPRVVQVPVRDAGVPGRLDQPRPSTPLVPTPEGEFWAAVVQQLIDAGAVSALVRELALQSQLVSREGARWLLRIERESLNQGSNRERLAAALQSIGHAVELAVEQGAVSDSPARRNAAEAERRQREAEQQILADPFVQTMMRDFGGTIVPGSLKPLTSH
ncbi:DNA polymerase III subunit gamma/tau [Hydrogenophaga intermedia]|jgi:DNA polymerase III subunit gamma/tau|uniref:DNA polymerase III subunit gamma/tau n=1 Tax=Hydrogenophaga intermedia TaxID=65786 RepID=UPI0020443B8B|nr:DNA polymerase III subunit gamma/tau [Hydrogenophaga intermedia]MCM3563204.1 DNA polymerase III subunit gamma/tau [Hydrogenophaga intermedia]